MRVHFGTGAGYRKTFAWEKVHFERLPIPKISEEAQSRFIALVDKIIAAKSANPPTDTAALEAEIDRRVYALYGLTDDEVAVYAAVCQLVGNRLRRARSV